MNDNNDEQTNIQGGSLADALSISEEEPLEVQEAKRVLGELFRPVEELFKGTVTEIMVNRPDDIWYEDREGMHHVDIRITKEGLEAAIVALGRIAGIDANEQNPIVDARIGKHLRIGAVLEPASIEGPTMCIRRHVPIDASLSMYGEDVAEISKQVLRESRNLLVAGATGSGKTTYINSLLASLPPDDRLVVIEDTPELHVKNGNRVRFETRGNADMSALLRESLRQRPDRIVLGELRGKEAYDLLQAFSTGHGGSFSTIHAGSPQEALMRLSSLVGQAEEARSWPQSAIRAAIAATVGAIVVLKKKRVIHIDYVNGLTEHGGFDLESIYQAEY